MTIDSGDVHFEQFLHFVEMDEFRQDWEGLGLDIDSDLWTPQIAIMQDPTQAPVITGTGGLRKLRFSPPSRRQGKSGAIRVCYVYFPLYQTILLAMAYGKSQKANLTAREKQGIRHYIAAAERWLERHKPR